MPKPYYTDDRVTLYHGDCREVTDWLAGDVLVTDPPYGIRWRIGDNKKRWTEKHEGILNDQDTGCRDTALHLWGARPGLVFGTWTAPFPHHRQVLVWRKPGDSGVIGSTIGFRTDTELIFVIGRWPRRAAQWSSVLVTEGNKNAYLRPAQHPHSKPIALMETLIATAPDGVVADPFAGSGSTLIAAGRLGRRVIGVEIEERYCETAAQRLAQLTLEVS